MTKKLTTVGFIAKARERHGSTFDYTKTVYSLSHVKVIVTCKAHGDFLVTPNNHISKANLSGCPICGGTHKSNTVEFIKNALTVHEGVYAYPNVTYTTNSTPIPIECPVHGEFMQSPRKHLMGRGCYICGGTARKSLASWVYLANKKHRNKYSYELLPNNITGRSYVRIICPKHGEFTQQVVCHVARGSGCVSCGQKSSQEEVIRDFLIGQGCVVERRNRKVIAPKEIDLWLPRLNIGIEYHGLYWHTYNRVGNAHREKWEQAQKQHVRLIQIFEDEWLNKPEMVKSRLLAIVGKSPSVFARKTTLKTISVSEANNFLVMHHIQGRSNASVAYGLFFETLLVAVATFGRVRNGARVLSDSKIWEVYRYASINRVVGGFSKVFKRFLKDVQPHKVVSYCDLRYGNGKLYEAVGFTLETITQPDYWWVPKGKIIRVPRYKTQKHKLKTLDLVAHVYDATKTETQICEAAGMQKIYGVGHQKWIYQNIQKYT